MNNNITEIVFILDMSGSMYELTQDTIGGFNSTIAQHKNTEGQVLVSTVVFNDRSRIIHDRIPIAEVPVMTEKEYAPHGCTALVDSMAETIKHIARIHHYARPEDRPGKTLFIITTDGMENASRRFSADELRKLVEHEKEKYGWEFLFYGANIDAVSTAARYGIDESRAVSYHNDAAGTAVKFKSMNMAVKMCCMPMDCCVADAMDDGEWRKEADADYKARKRGRK